MKQIELLNNTKLAAYLGRSRNYVSAMKKAGFKFSHGTRTDPRKALDWLAANPSFRTMQSYPRRPSKPVDSNQPTETPTQPSTTPSEKPRNCHKEMSDILRFRCEPELRNRLEGLATNYRLKESQVARMAIWEYIEREEAALRRNGHGGSGPFKPHPNLHHQ